MTETTYDVRVWKTERWEGKTKTTYYVRWRVGPNPFKEPFATSGLAKGFRSKLVAAMGDGVAFEVTTGLPVTMRRNSESATTWYDFACSYVDMKWPEASPGHRKSIADSLIPITVSMLKTSPRKGDEKQLRKSLRCAFNANTRGDPHSAETTEWLRWARHNSKRVSALKDPETLRKLLTDLNVNLDGKRAAPDTIRLRRTTLTSALDYAVEKQILPANPLHEVRTTKNKTVLRQVDRRSVANPVQARTLLRAVSTNNHHLVAFFGLMYFAALRPEEAADLRKHNLSLPDHGWGEIHLERATPEIAEEWTDSRTRSEQRGLKHREDDTGRTVPCSPELTEILHTHLDTHGTGSGDRLFWGRRSRGRISSSVYGRVWAQAREATFTPTLAASPLAKRPYDLRHAAVSTWLNAGVEATRVAEWAGHSLSVLLRVYAKCLDGGEQAARDRVQIALGRR